jgi:CBS domain containing-hemolysin-like protein
MVSVPVVPESIPLDDLLDQLRRRGLQMAVVADEYGGTAGILTLEDVVEELVGEIQDEHDPRVNRGERRADDTWLLPGTLRPDEIEEITGVSLPESGAYETVAGLLIARLGRIPVPADTVTVPATMAAWSRLGATAQVAGDEPVSGRADDDLPRAVHVRLTVHRMLRRRVDAVVLSAVGLDEDRDLPDDERADRNEHPDQGDRSGSRDGSAR